MGSIDTGAPDLRYIPLSYTPADSQASALRLILSLNPDWEGPGNKIEFVRFTDGITNTVRPTPPVYGASTDSLLSCPSFSKSSTASLA